MSIISLNKAGKNKNIAAAGEQTTMSPTLIKDWTVVILPNDKTYFLETICN